MSFDDDLVEAIDPSSAPFLVCGRAAGLDLNPATSPRELREKHATCAAFDPKEKTLLLDGNSVYGRTGNNLNSLLQAKQYTRDNGLQLGIAASGWAMNLLTSMWMVKGGEVADWIADMEGALCLKVFESKDSIKGWNIVPEHRPTLAMRLFFYLTPSKEEDYAASQQEVLRTLFRRHNDGEGTDHLRKAANDMCSGIDAVFGKDGRGSAVYTAIHLRHLEGQPGIQSLARQSKLTGCDPKAALEMKPSYVKSILEPLEMLRHPVVIIHDGQNMKAVERLMADEDIGPMVRVVPPESCWFGGDITLAIMSDVFIGNPASSMTQFIGRTRVALGLGGNFIYRAKDDKGEWETVCGDKCLFQKEVEEPFYYMGWPQRRKH
ncbi:hypothetical protein ACHAWF_003942 [Thalassiosira exigua]